MVQAKAQKLTDRVAQENGFSVEDSGWLTVVYHNIGGDVMIDFQIGQYLYMHSTAAGKDLLAKMPEHRIDEIID
ncbi:hypothetical protein VB773_00040 [Haloarculaceae archaeon H-GB2-1]|nr:IclR family transcriptional regulator C-terminal domain-containing protein [Haloarculaceae archaeon H-GB1-1]MEA5406123.1 hypothetical protein [Haloarculaceae archaeon H-GB2-1]